MTEPAPENPMDLRSAPPPLASVPPISSLGPSSNSSGLASLGSVTPIVASRLERREPVAPELADAPVSGSGLGAPPRGPINPRYDDRAVPGRTTVADEVVEKVTAIAARKVIGVFDLGGDVSRALSGLRERIGLGDAGAGRGVSVDVREGRAFVNLTLVIEYGNVVREVTESVRAEVWSGIEKMLGLEVAEINIVVDDVHLPEAR